MGLSRILVTGSRLWGANDNIYEKTMLQRALTKHFSLGTILVSGASPKGADQLAEYWWAKLGSGEYVERHPADWGRHGKRAGYIRNADMVGLGAELCLAFLLWCNDPNCERKEPHRTHGASHCADLAEKAGIKVRRYTTGA